MWWGPFPSRLRKVRKAKSKPKKVRPARMVLGIRRISAWQGIHKGRQASWALSRNPAADRGLRNANFADRGLVSLLDRFRLIWAAINAPAQLMLPLGSTRS